MHAYPHGLYDLLRGQQVGGGGTRPTWPHLSLRVSWRRGGTPFLLSVLTKPDQEL